MKTYLEVRNIKTNEVVKRLDLTGRSDREKEKIEMGLLRNMNMDDFFTSCFDSELELHES